MNAMKLLGVGVLFSLAQLAQAQTQETSKVAKPAPRQVPETDMMYRKTVWRTVDLREKQNKPFFADSRQISRIITEAARRGDLPIYRNDSLTSTITVATFLEKLTMVQEETDGLTPEQIEMGFNRSNDSDWFPEGTEDLSANVGPEEFLPRDLYQLEIKEDAIFDKKRSRMYHEIKAITLVVPASLKTNLKLRDIPVGTFKYSDLVEVFRKYPAQAQWVNPHNDAEHKNLADAFELRLFSSFITKISNPDNESLEDIHNGPKEGLLASQQVANQLIEYEYNLWSF